MSEPIEHAKAVIGRNLPLEIARQQCLDAVMRRLGRDILGSGPHIVDVVEEEAKFTGGSVYRVKATATPVTSERDQEREEI